MLNTVRVEDIPATVKGRKRAHKKGGPTDIVLNFVASGDSAAEVLVDQLANIKCVYDTYYITAKRIGAPVRVIRCDGRVFLVKEDNNA